MSDNNREQATLGGGCFWCLEAVFSDLKGVEQVLPGYSGGTVPNPSYELVCTNTTNHAEVVQITYDPAVISYEELLDVFFSIHDPTTLNRQGEDVGTQYRSVIFTTMKSKKPPLKRRSSITSSIGAIQSLLRSHLSMCSTRRRNITGSTFAITLTSLTAAW